MCQKYYYDFPFQFCSVFYPSITWAPAARYEVAPTVVNFTRSLLVSFAQPLGELTESGLSNTKGASRAPLAGQRGLDVLKWKWNAEMRVERCYCKRRVS